MVLGTWGLQKSLPKLQEAWVAIEVELLAAVDNFFTTTQSSLDNLEPSASPSPSPTPEPWVMPTEKQKRWYLAQGAIIQYQNNEGYALVSKIGKNDLTQMMKDSWDAYDHDSSVKTILWLENEGHRKQFESLIQTIDLMRSRHAGSYTLAKEEYMLQASKNGLKSDYVVDWSWDHRNLKGIPSLYAWDYMRLVNVVRYSYTLGYITEDEAWQYMVPAGKKMQRTFPSWVDASNNYILGRQFWSWDDDQSYVEDIRNYLLVSETSPWVKVPWDTEL